MPYLWTPYLQGMLEVWKCTKSLEDCCINEKEENRYFAPYLQQSYKHIVHSNTQNKAFDVFVKKEILYTVEPL